MGQLQFQDALPVAADLIARLVAKPGSPFLRPPPEHHLRGIDYYTATGLIDTLARALCNYHEAHGALPDLISPASMTEKWFWAKFFMPAPVPSPADKLSAIRFVPHSQRKMVKAPPVVWSSALPELPTDRDIPPGRYVLKANHGNHMNLELTFPLTTEKRRAAEVLAKRWLSTKYGLSWGEWWYATVSPRLLLEKHLVCNDGPLLDYKFLVVRGQVDLIYVMRYHARGYDASIYSRGLEKQAVTLDGSANPDIEFPPNIGIMIEAAEAIGRQFLMVRVDFYDLGEAIGLGELTLCPGNARHVYAPAHFAVDVGRRWHLG
jgi:hypothetical protein